MLWRSRQLQCHTLTRKFWWRWSAIAQQPGLHADTDDVVSCVNSKIYNKYLSLAATTSNNRGPTEDYNYVGSVILGDGASAEMLLSAEVKYRPSSTTKAKLIQYCDDSRDHYNTQNRIVSIAICNPTLMDEHQ